LIGSYHSQEDASGRPDMASCTLLKRTSLSSDSPASAAESTPTFSRSQKLWVLPLSP
jgi:hypothetical protein